MVKNSFNSISFVIIFLFMVSSVAISIQFNQPITSSTSNQNNNSTDIMTIHSEPSSNSQLNANTLLKSILNNNNQLFFIKNTGQIFQSSIVFYFSSSDYQINFLQAKIQFVQKSQNIGSYVTYVLSFKDSNLVNPVGEQQISRVNNYFLNKQKNTNVPLFNELIYYNIYNRIDLRFYFTGQDLKYEFIVHPGSNPNQIKLQSSSNTVMQATGTSLEINSQLDGLNLVNDKNLYVYQNIESNKVKVNANFKIDSVQKTSVLFKIDSYNPHYDLIIDPVLVVNTSTYLGGTKDDSGIDMVLDNQSNVYITGTTYSSDFIALNTINGTYSRDLDIFVMKLNSTGNGIMWFTYFGGNGDDIVSRISLETLGNVVIVGQTYSTDLPISQGTSQNNYLNGTSDGLLVVFSNNGQQMKLCSLIGGDQDEAINGLFINGTNYYLTGYTNSANFTTSLNAYNKTYGNDTDAFLIKTSVTGAISYSTFIGGNKFDEGVDIALDSNSNIYVLGNTESNIEGHIHQGTIITPDVFIMKFSSSGSYLNSTLMGGNLQDFASSMVIYHNQIFITGTTYSSNFPTSINAFDRVNSFVDAFVTKILPNFTIDYSTLFGGSNTTWSNKIIVDLNNQAYIFGWTNSPSLSLKNEFKKGLSGAQDGFIAAFNDQGTNLIYASTFGGSQDDQINSGALGTQNLIYYTGTTNSLDYPVNSAIHSNNAYIGTYDMIFTIISPDYITPILELKPNFSYISGTIGHNLTFIASDNDPEAYYIIYKDGQSQATGPLSVDKMGYSVDGLAIGTYNFTVLVEDRTGNRVPRTCIVTVIAQNPSSSLSETSTTPNGSLYDLLIISFFTLALVVIGTVGGVIMTKNRMNKNNLSKNTPQKSSNLNNSSTNQSEEKNNVDPNSPKN